MNPVVYSVNTDILGKQGFEKLIDLINTGNRFAEFFHQMRQRQMVQIKQPVLP